MTKRVIAFAAVAALTSLPLGAQPYNLTLSGASPGGLWSAIGTGMNAALAKGYPGSTLTYQTSSGGLANIQLVSQGKVPMGIASDGELKYAVTGREPFKTPITNMRALVRVFGADSRFQMTHLILSRSFAEKHGVKTFADIVDKKLPLRVVINRRGNFDGDVSEALMAEMGASVKNIESWGGQVVRAASREQASLYQDRRVDLMNYGVAFNHPSLQEATKGVDSTLLGVPAAVAAKVASDFGAGVCTIKPGEYDWTPNGADTVCVGAMIVVSDSMDAGLAYNLAKAMVEQIEEFKDKSHRSIKATLTPKVLGTKSVVPFHPGAEKLLKEKGLL